MCYCFWIFEGRKLFCVFCLFPNNIFPKVCKISKVKTFILHFKVRKEHTDFGVLLLLLSLKALFWNYGEKIKVYYFIQYFTSGIFDRFMNEIGTYHHRVKDIFCTLVQFSSFSSMTHCDKVTIIWNLRSLEWSSNESLEGVPVRNLDSYFRD